jgi:hypothetical protein
MMVMVVVAMMESRTAMEPAMEPRTWTGEHHTCRCHGRQHYYQFLVHVFLLFLSLSTKGMATSPEKSDNLFKKNFVPPFSQRGVQNEACLRIKALHARFRR